MDSFRPKWTHFMQPQIKHKIITLHHPYRIPRISPEFRSDDKFSSSTAHSLVVYKPWDSFLGKAKNKRYFQCCYPMNFLFSTAHHLSNMVDPGQSHQDDTAIRRLPREGKDKTGTNDTTRAWLLRKSTAARASRPPPSGLEGCRPTNSQQMVREMSFLPNVNRASVAGHENHSSPSRTDTYPGDTYRFYVYFEEYIFNYIWIYLKHISRRCFERQ